MPATTRIYEICDNETGKSRLIEATSGSQALRFVAQSRYTVGTPNPKEVARLIGTDGVKLESAGEAQEPAA